MRTFNISIIILLNILAFSVNAQRIKYKDLVPALDTASTSEQFMMLRAFLAEEPDEANANLRLALYHYNTFRNADPLLEYKKAMAHAKEAILRLTKAKIIVTPQEVKSDNEYYAPIFKTFDSKGKPYVEFLTVQQKMNNAFDSANHFINRMPAIYSAFTKSVKHYDKAVKNFADINTEYQTLEDIYMLFDDSFDQRLTALETSYDSAIHYFKKYQSLIAEYPLKKYNQKTQIKRIDVYRMDGLITSLSFLTPVVDFWNYAEWVSAIRSAYKNEISGLKEKVIATETKLNESLKTLESSELPAEQLVKVGKDVTFQLNNYDKNSLALSLMDYKAFKQNWLLKLHSIKRDTASDAKLQLYSNLIQINRAADSLVNHIKANTTEQGIKKHKLYLDKYYGGANGIKKFIDDESEFIRTAFQNYQTVLQSGLKSYNPYTEYPNKFVKIGGLNVPLFAINKPVSLLDNINLQTIKITKLPDGSVYLAGVHKTNKKTNNNLITYVARLNADGKAAWLRELNFNPDSVGVADANNYLGDFVTTQEGCAIVVTSIKSASGSVLNNFVFINDKGEVKVTPLKESALARKIVYQESSNSFVMVFKGNEEKQQYQKEEPVSITSINILGDLLWHQDIAVTGTFQDLIQVRDGYIVVGNFAVLKDMKGKELRTKLVQGQSNPYLIKLNFRGDKVNVMPITTDKSIVIDRVVKVNDNSINLLGYQSAFGVLDDPSIMKGAETHLMTNYNLKTICSTF